MIHVSRKRLFGSSLWNIAKGLITQTSESDPWAWISVSASHREANCLTWLSKLWFPRVQWVPLTCATLRCWTAQSSGRFSCSAILISVMVLPLPFNTVYMPKSLKCFSIPDLSSKPQAQIMIYIPNISAGPCYEHLKLNMPQTNLLIPAAPYLPYV